jgi:repressor LexA
MYGWLEENGYVIEKDYDDSYTISKNGRSYHVLSEELMSVSQEIKNRSSQGFELAMLDWERDTFDKYTSESPERPLSNAKAGAPPRETSVLPVYGSISAGRGTLAEQEIIGYEPVEEKYADDEHFWLVVKGNSMSPKIESGDYVLIKIQPEVEDSAIGAFVIDEVEGFVKQIHRHNGRIELVSFNDIYPPIVFEGKNKERLRTVGKVIKLIRKM